MGTDTTTAFYRDVLAAAPVAPQPVLRAAARAALTTRDTALLQMIARRPDTPDDVLRQCAQLGDRDLRATLLSRALSDGTAPMATERRAAVLARALTATSNPPTPLFDQAVGVFADKPTKVLAEAFMRMNPSRFTATQCAQILTALDTGYTTTQRRWDHATRFAARAGHGAVVAILERTSSPWLVVACLRLPVPADVAAAATARALTSVTCEHTAGSARFRQAARELLIACLSAQPGAGAGIRAAVIDALPADYLEAVVTPLLRTPTTVSTPAVWDLTPAEAHGPGSPQRPLQPGPTQRRALSASPDPHVLHSLVAAHGWLEGAGDVVDVTALTSLVHNPALPTDELHLVLADLQSRGYGFAATGDPSQIDALTTHPDDEIVRQVWCDLFTASVLTRHGWEPFGGSCAAPAVLRAAWQGSTQERRDDLIRALETVAAPAAAYAEISMPDLSKLLRPGLASAPRVAAAVTGLCTQALGPDGPAWEVFTNLSSTFQGTLRELLDTCATIAAPEPPSDQSRLRP